MLSFRVVSLCCFCLLLVACDAGFSVAAEPDEAIRFDVPKDWRGERIKLPPSFAADLKLKGIEEVRFAPGMFRADANDFFSYVIVFRLEGRPKLPKKTLERELLVYYRGLAKAVGRGKIKTDDFSIDVKPDEKFKAKDEQQYHATLKWIEPFATKKPQTLRIEIRIWDAPESRRTWAFMSVSPNGADDPIWKQMRKIRDDFLKVHGAAKDAKDK